jgi:hypothetical protein
LLFGGSPNTRFGAEYNQNSHKPAGLKNRNSLPILPSSHYLSPYNESDCTAKELLSAIHRFIAWLDREGLESYDPYDIWGTRYGLWSRKVYYGSRWLGTPLVAPLVLIDFICPAARKYLVQKQRFATADAQILLGYINLYEITSDPQYLVRAIALGDEILGYAISGYHGPCWGYPFDWQRDSGTVWVRNTPYITCTPYCYEAFLRLSEVTHEPRYLTIIQGIAEFVFRDLRDTKTSLTASAGSYSPHDSGKVINASAYRAWLLIDAGRRFDRADHIHTGIRNLNFVLESQQDDGSWLYAVDPDGKFIDNFHTCFNLKNLIKINRLLAREDITGSIMKGFEYYREHLFHPNSDPKSFAIEPRFQLAKLEMYNFAEGITLGSLLGTKIPEAAAISHRLAGRLVRDFQLPVGHFVTRVFHAGKRHTFPFLRWPQAQLFLAITNLLRGMPLPLDKNMFMIASQGSNETI